MNNNPQVILKNRYVVVPRILILLIRDGEVLLQKAALTKKIWAGKYNGLGGHIEQGEDVLSAARRELQEESGLLCLNLRMAGSVMIDVEETQGILMFVFTGSELQGQVKDSEEGTLDWKNVNQISSLPVVEDIPMLIDKINGQKGNELFFGHYGYDEAGKLIATFN